MTLNHGDSSSTRNAFLSGSYNSPPSQVRIIGNNVYGNITRDRKGAQIGHGQFNVTGSFGGASTDRSGRIDYQKQQSTDSIMLGSSASII